MVAAVSDLLEAGRIKLYCVGSLDAESWSDRGHPPGGARPPARGLRGVDPRPGRPLGARRLRRRRRADPCGVSLGAFHAANFALKRADLFPLAICMSGNYDPAAWDGWGERGEAAYFNNPMDYVPHLEGEHLDWLRGRAEPPAGVRAGPVGGHHRCAGCDPALRGAARRQGHPARARPLGVRRRPRLAVVARQLAHHLPRFC